MTLSTATLPNGNTVHCLNPYELEYSVHEIFNDDLTRHGLDLPRNGVFFDVGANIGLFALYIHEQCPDASIYCYEPIPAVFEALERNLANLSGNCHAFRLGLGAARGNVEFDYYPGITGLSTCNQAAGQVLSQGLRSILLGDANSEDVRDIRDRQHLDPQFVAELLTPTKVQCPIGRLSDELSAKGHGTVDLLKIDTEGSEEDVLAGLEPGDWAKIRQLMIEVHLGRDTLDKLNRQLQSLGYRTSTEDHPMAKGGAPVFHLYARRS
jgi:FkbM family methyltransferase